MNDYTNKQKPRNRYPQPRKKREAAGCTPTAPQDERCLWIRLKEFFDCVKAFFDCMESAFKVILLLAGAAGAVLACLHFSPWLAIAFHLGRVHNTFEAHRQ